ncbi:MAG: outer membrane protein assembly factor BamE [Parvibaculales bacterium]
MNKVKSKKKSNHLIATVCAASLLACSPVIHNRGYIFQQESLDKLVAGSTTKDEVRSIMGSPSSIATIDASVFYYISSREETYLYRAPVETNRRIVAIYFDENNIVKNTAQYGLEDGNVVDYVSRETKTRGKELTLLGQLFGNLGRFNSSSSGVPGSGQ